MLHCAPLVIPDWQTHSLGKASFQPLTALVNWPRSSYSFSPPPSKIRPDEPARISMMSWATCSLSPVPTVRELLPFRKVPPGQPQCPAVSRY